MADVALQARVQRLVGSDVADQMLQTLRAVGGEGRRKDLIQAAIERNGWSEQELAIGPARQGAAQKGRVRLAYDDSLDVLQQRGLIESTGILGHWRLTSKALIVPSKSAANGGSPGPHPHGHVYIASVGVSGSPVDDAYNPAAFDHLWFAKPAHKVFRNGHVFIVGVGLHGAILGLYEINSWGTKKDVAHPHDNERWPWSLAVTPLASTSVSDAVHVASIKAPQGNLVSIKDPAVIAELYAALEGRAVPAAEDAASAAEPVVEVPGPEVVLRRARAFDPDRAPTPAQIAQQGWVVGAEALALQEKARQGHHALLARLAAQLQAAGWTRIEEIPMAVDLWAVDRRGRRVLFEAKTLRDENQVRQSRSAHAQLLEYRYEHGTDADFLCLVTDQPLDAHRTEMLQSFDVAVLTVGDGAWHGENALAVELGLGVDVDELAGSGSPVDGVAVTPRERELLAGGSR